MSQTETEQLTIDTPQFYSSIFRPQVKAIVFAEQNHYESTSLQNGIKLMQEAAKSRRAVKILTEHFSPELLDSVKNKEQLRDLVLGNHPKTTYNKRKVLDGASMTFGDLFLPFMDAAFDAGEFVSYGCNDKRDSFDHTGLPSLLQRSMAETEKLNIAFIGERHLTSMEENMLKILPPSENCIYLTQRKGISSITPNGKNQYTILGSLR